MDPITLQALADAAGDAPLVLVALWWLARRFDRLERKLDDVTRSCGGTPSDPPRRKSAPR